MTNPTGIPSGRAVPSPSAPVLRVIEAIEGLLEDTTLDELGDALMIKGITADGSNHLCNRIIRMIEDVNARNEEMYR